MKKEKLLPILIIIALSFLAVLLIVIFVQSQPKNSQEEITSLEIPQNGQPEEKLVALGSSLSRASNLSSDMQGENNNYNFSTGTKINSVNTYLKSQGRNITVTNLAHPGADMQDILERQLPEALRLNPKYITIDPASDLVGKNSITNYKNSLDQILGKINPEAVVMIFTYPNFIFMRSANYSSCRENKVGVNLENLSQENILLFNQAIKNVVGDRKNIILVDIYNLLGPKDVSDYDCLHINLGGQKKIAAEFIRILELQRR